jgi:hypothetical protein
MNADINLFGVFVDTGLVTALVAGTATLLARKLFARAGLYRHVWHPALVDGAVFVVAWMLCVLAGGALVGPLAGLLS